MTLLMAEARLYLKFKNPALKGRAKGRKIFLMINSFCSGAGEPEQDKSRSKISRHCILHGASAP